MNNIIDISKRVKAKADEPSEDCVMTDDGGTRWFKYSVSYKSGIDTVFSFYIWAKSFDDAERRLIDIKNHAEIDGQIFETIDA